MAGVSERAGLLRGAPLAAWLVLVGLGQVAAIGVGIRGLDGPAGWLVVVGTAGLCGVLLMAWMLVRSARQLDRLDDPQQRIAELGRDLELARNQNRAADVRLREVLDAIPAGLAVYDNQDRLLLFNGEVSSHYPYRDEGQPVVGETYEDLLRRALDGGHIPDAIGREEEWLALRLRGRGSLDAPLLRHTDDGQWVHFYENRTPSGYLVMTRLDMTQMVEKGLALERANEQLLRLSTTDGLTGIANRRLFDQTLISEWQRCGRNLQALSLLMVDIDHFKRFNDHYGHQTGDECLRQVARLLAACVKRAGELVARYGGEEFVVLLPGSDAAEAMAVARRCLDEVTAARIAHADSPVSPWLTLSIGVASMQPSPDDAPNVLVSRADAAMVAAKRSGRACCHVFDPADLNAPASRAAPR